MTPQQLPYSRYDLPRIIDDRGYRYGAEVGVEHGHFSYYLLKHSKLQQLVSIDSYEGKWAPLQADAQSLLLEFGTRSIILPRSSREFATGTGVEFDFVYLDGDHRYRAIREDIQLWWPLVRKGGLLSGHDYVEANRCGVIQAVNEFVQEYNLQLQLTREAWASWLVFKE